MDGTYQNEIISGVAIVEYNGPNRRSGLVELPKEIVRIFKGDPNHSNHPQWSRGLGTPPLNGTIEGDTVEFKGIEGAYQINWNGS